MTTEQWNEAHLLAYRTRLEAMLVENKEREKDNHSPAWNSEDFFLLEQEIIELSRN